MLILQREYSNLQHRWKWTIGKHSMTEEDSNILKTSRLIVLPVRAFLFLSPEGRSLCVESSNVLNPFLLISHFNSFSLSQSHVFLHSFVTMTSLPISLSLSHSSTIPLSCCPSIFLIFLMLCVCVSAIKLFSDVFNFTCCDLFKQWLCPPMDTHIRTHARRHARTHTY